MRTARRTSMMLVVAVLVLLGSLAGVALAEGDIVVQVSPNVLNLQSKGGSLSLHTDLDFDSAEGVVLTVDDTVDDTVGDDGQVVPDIETFADACGNLVVKADLDTIKEMVADLDEAKFELTVETPDGTYVGSDTIDVISRSGEGQEDPPKNKVMTLVRKMVQNRKNH